jgi:hypothetical protein
MCVCVCVCVCVGGVRRVALRCKTKLLGYRMCVCVCVVIWKGVSACGLMGDGSGVLHGDNNGKGVTVVTEAEAHMETWG